MLKYVSTRYTIPEIKMSKRPKPTKKAAIIAEAQWVVWHQPSQKRAGGRMKAPRIIGGRRASGGADLVASQSLLYHVSVKMEKKIQALMMPRVMAMKGR